MATYNIAQHFKDIRADTGRRKGRPSPFATGFEDDSDSDRKRSRPKTKAPPVAKPPIPSKDNISSPFASIDLLRDDDDQLLTAPPKKINRRPSPAPARLSQARTDGAGRRGSVDRGLAPTSRASRAAVAQAAGQLAYLDDSDDDGFSRRPRAERRVSPQISPGQNSEAADPFDRSPGGTPRGSDKSLNETSQTRNQPSRHTVASPFAGTKYLEDSDSDEEAVESRRNSNDNGAAAEEAANQKKPRLEVQHVDKPKQNGGSGISWRAFSASRAEQRNTEIEALQESLKQRGKSISFCPHVITDDGARIPLSPTLERPSFSAKGRSAKGRGKSPPRRAEDTRPTDDEVRDGSNVEVYDPTQYKTSPFTGQPIHRSNSDGSTQGHREMDRPGSSSSVPDIRVEGVSTY